MLRQAAGWRTGLRAMAAGLALLSPEAVPAAPPDLVEAFARTLREQCYPGNATPPNVPVDRVDLNGDKRPDAVIDASRYDCPTKPAQFANLGSLVTVFTAQEDGTSRPELQQYAFGSRIQTTPEGPRLWLTLGGSGCGSETDNARCERAVGWNPKAKKLMVQPPPSGR